MRIKLLSLNLWHGALIERCVEFLDLQDADVVLLQEVHNGLDAALPPRLRSLSAIQDKLNYPHRVYAEALLFNHPEGKIPNGNAILSKYRITGSDFLFFHETFNQSYDDIPENYPKYPRVLQHAQLETPVGEINAFNFHGVWDLDGDNYSDRRREMGEKIIAAIKGKQNVILGGDTNAKPSNQAIKNVEEHLKSVFGTTLKSTFNMRHKDNPGYATAAVDMLFVSPNIKILDKQCPNIDVSDHLPVVATLEVN
jgi:endonuclease/exonuclease/phosphatase family metal-dependent hydrolase